jgi:transcriptional regulator with XRE-family HTH domain
MGGEDDEPWPLGDMLRRARGNPGRPGFISQREAARRAGISEGRWRQIEAGHRFVGGQRVRETTSASRVARMARAVGIDEHAAVVAAGLDPQEIEIIDASEAETERIRLVNVAHDRALTTAELADINVMVSAYLRRNRQSPTDDAK